MRIGTTPQQIAEAEAALGVTFPDGLKATWLVSNGLELPGGWQLYPVWDPSNPRKSACHIVYENTKGRWEMMAPDLYSIASNEVGNQLVLKAENGILQPQIYVWNHDTNRIRKWSRTLHDAFLLAQKRITEIERQIARGQAQSLKRRGSS